MMNMLKTYLKKKEDEEGGEGGEAKPDGEADGGEDDKSIKTKGLGNMMEEGALNNKLKNKPAMIL
jgi:hypothetical protein